MFLLTELRKLFKQLSKVSLADQKLLEEPLELSAGGCLHGVLAF